jgi:hypothetical protein
LALDLFERETFLLEVETAAVEVIGKVAEGAQVVVAHGLDHCHYRPRLLYRQVEL